MTTVLGIDVSLTATGLAAVTSDGFTVTTVGSVGKRGDSLAARERRIDRLVRDISQFIENWPDFELAVIEGPSIMSKGGSNWDRAWLWGEVVQALGGEYTAVAAPATVKRWAAGKGNADKAAVAVGVARLWPQFECGSDNEADALALASMGAQRLRMNLFPKRAHHWDCLSKVEWPQFIRDRDEVDVEMRQDRTADADDRGEDQ